jgi:hypothetical protein
VRLRSREDDLYRAVETNDGRLKTLRAFERIDCGQAHDEFDQASQSYAVAFGKIFWRARFAADLAIMPEIPDPVDLVQNAEQGRELIFFRMLALGLRR